MNMTQDTTKTVASPSGLQRVTVLGTGVLGAQIAFQCAFHGKSVTAYDIDAAAQQRGGVGGEDGAFARQPGEFGID